MLIELHIDEYHTLITTLILFGNKIKAKDTESGDKGYTEDERRVFTDQLRRIDAFCRKVQIDTGQSLYRVTGKIHNPHLSEYPAYVYWVALAERILDELRERTFMFIPKPQNDYYNNDALFGKEVYEKFKGAREDLKEAGNCYATGAYTACVFHLMRAVEVALKRMVVSMNAKQYLPKPIELCDWEKLINGLRSAKNAMQQNSSQNARLKAKYAFYSEAINTFVEFKDAWRNTISHGHDVPKTKRKLYKQGETEDIMKNVSHFLRHLAKSKS